jgi:hypothetical protein
MPSLTHCGAYDTGDLLKVVVVVLEWRYLQAELLKQIFK